MSNGVEPAETSIISQKHKSEGA
jgi:hypothetical protein